MTARLLVVDDDPIVASSLRDFFEGDGHECVAVHHPEDALRHLETSDFSVMIADVSLPGMNGIDLIRRVTSEFPGTASLVLTGYGTVELAVDALRAGAVDFLIKPVVDDELRLALERALRQHALLSENQRLRHQLDERYGLDSIVGADARMLRIYELIEAVAPSRTTVLMNGESGTGKSLIAHAIHRRSDRASGPFIELSCGSIPETLLESELFGHVKGAFTGAHADKQGRFLAADGGTLFLDEINSASPGMQLKLLRVLQEKRFEPVGSTETIESDVRIVLASNQPLERLVSEGTFRQDLYYRINVVTIDLPPLRDRVSDIPLLAMHFLEHHGRELKRQFTGFTDEAMDALVHHRWPGNIRELQNAIERAAVLTRQSTIGLHDLPPSVTSQAAPVGAAASGGRWTPMSLSDAMREPEREIITRALEANEWNRQRTAEVLEINRTTLYKKMKQLGIGEG
ncbi:MAG: sigma-54-dependent Fis family transcriptional regulator [Phycisphaerales bacterium]|nr:sigma-54-dependent Fis family transcriptional regulator [Phycisphaerales bacterium]